MEALRPSFQSLVQSHSSSSPVDNKKTSTLQSTKHYEERLESKVEENWRETINNDFRYWIYSSLHNCKVHYPFCITDHVQKTRINLLSTSSWIFFSFSFSSEVETGFDLLPSKLMYNPPSAFTLMPGSMRLDNSFLKQIGTNSSAGAERSHPSPLHTATIICNNDVSEARDSV